MCGVDCICKPRCMSVCVCCGNEILANENYQNIFSISSFFLSCLSISPLLSLCKLSRRAGWWCNDWRWRRWLVFGGSSIRKFCVYFVNAFNYIACVFDWCLLQVAAIHIHSHVFCRCVEWPILKCDAWHCVQVAAAHSKNGICISTNNSSRPDLVVESGKGLERKRHASNHSRTRKSHPHGALDLRVSSHLVNSNVELVGHAASGGGKMERSKMGGSNSRHRKREMKSKDGQRNIFIFFFWSCQMALRNVCFVSFFYLMKDVDNSGTDEFSCNERDDFFLYDLWRLTFWPWWINCWKNYTGGPGSPGSMGSSDATSNGNGSSGSNGVCSSNTTNGHGSSNGSNGPCNENSSCIDSSGCIDSHRGASSNEVSLSPPPSSPSLLNALPLCLAVLYTSIYLFCQACLQGITFL